MTISNWTQYMDDWQVAGTAPVITVRTTAEFEQALNEVGSGGGTILLDGNGGPFSMSVRNYRPEGAVVITSLNDAQPAKLITAEMTNTSNVALVGLEIPGTGSGPAVRISTSDTIGLIGNTMYSDADGYVTETNGAERGGGAALVRNSSDIVIAGNTASNMFHAFGVLETTGLQFLDNELWGIQGDGFRVGGLQDSVISGNYMHDFYGTSQSLNHSDMIQLWGSNTEMVTRNVIISDNILDAGNGAATQSIFGRNETFGKGDAPANGYFENITITGNVINNGHYHGITMSDTVGLIIKDNTVLWNQAANIEGSASVAPWILANNAPGAVIEGNIASKVTNSTSGYTAETTTSIPVADGENYVISYTDSSADNYANAHFVNLAGTGDTDLRDLMLRPDSPLYGTLGAWLSSNSPIEQPVQAVMATQDVTGHMLAIDLSAEFSREDGALIDTDTVEAVWTFSDGTQLEGWDIRYVFDTPGTHEVTLELREGDGLVRDQITRIIEVDDPTLFHVNFDTGVTDLSTYQTEFDLTASAASALVDTPDGMGLHIQSGSRLIVDRKTAQLTDLNAFDISLTLQKDTAGGVGQIFNMHNTMRLQVESDGSLKFNLRTDDGGFNMRSDAGVLSNTNWADIRVFYDGVAGEMKLFLDGEVIASANASGYTTPETTQSFIIGGIWGPTLPAVVEQFTISSPLAEGVVTSGETYSGQTPELQPLVVTEDETKAEPVEVAPDPIEAPAVPRKTLLDIDFSDNGADKSDFGSSVFVKARGDEVFVDGREGEGFHLTGASDFAVSKENKQLLGLDNFELSLDVRLDEAGGTGILMRQHTILDVQILKGGAVQVKFSTDEGGHRLITNPGVINDTEWHNITLKFDNDAGELSLDVDGVTEASIEAGGVTREESYWSLVLGNPWGESVEATIDNFSITRDYEADEFNPIPQEGLL